MSRGESVPRNLSKSVVVYRVFATLLVLLVILAVAFGGYLYHYSHRSGPLEKTTRLVVPRGSSTYLIATLLADSHIIRSPRLFAKLSYFHFGASLRAGEYEFAPGITPDEVYTKLKYGDILYRKIVFPEGISTPQIVRKLDETSGLSGGITSDVPEGALFPDTYFFYYGEHKERLLERMQEKKREIMNELWPKRKKNLRFITTKRKAVILASIVEKEAGSEEEKPLIAAVFHNRLRKNMPLQSDPTVVYALTEGHGTLGRSLIRRDLEVDSPFNTYKHRGLPPTPISNPGRSSIEAVLHPADIKSLYFVADGEGGHLFADNLREHNSNVRRYRRILVEQD